MESMTQALVPAEQGTDLQLARQKSEAVATVEAQVFMAKQYPRNEDQAYARIIKSCERPGFAVDALYQYSRAGQPIEGGSVHLAREMKRLWGNIISGTRIVRDDGETVYGEAFAWDLETNTFDSRQFQVSKYLWKRGRGKEPGRFVLVGSRRGEDEKDLERDLREKIFNIASRSERECIFHVIPSDFRADAEAAALETIQKKVDTDPDAARKLVIRGMAKLNVDPTMMEGYLGCKLAQASPKQIEDLRRIYQKINAGEATWAEATGQEKPQGEAKGPVTVPINLDQVKPSADRNRGHDDTHGEEGADEEPPPTSAAAAASARVARLGGITPAMSLMVRTWRSLDRDPSASEIIAAVGAYEGSDDDLTTELDFFAEKVKLDTAGEESQETLFGAKQGRSTKRA